MSCCARDVTGPRAEHVPADDRRELHGPDEPRWQERVAGQEERRAEQVTAVLERVGDGDDDPLPVDEQVGQVVGDEVADGDRRQPRADGAPGHGPSDDERRAGDDPQEHDQDHGLLDERRVAEDRGEGHRLRQAVEDDRRGADGDQGDARDLPDGIEQAARERPADDGGRIDRVGVLVVRVDAPGLGGLRGGRDTVDGEPVQGPEPDREGLALGAPLVPPELGHEGQGEHGVAGEHHGQRPGPGHRDELEPDEEHEADDGGPDADRGRQVA